MEAGTCLCERKMERYRERERGERGGEREGWIDREEEERGVEGRGGLMYDLEGDSGRRAGLEHAGHGVSCVYRHRALFDDNLGGPVEEANPGHARFTDRSRRSLPIGEICG